MRERFGFVMKLGLGFVYVCEIIFGWGFCGFISYNCFYIFLYGGVVEK